MFGRVSEEMAVQVSATEAWELCGTLRLAKLCEEELSDVIHKVDIIQGDGGVGTIVRQTNISTRDAGIFLLQGEVYEITKIDNEKRVKETEVTERAYLEIGFTVYRVRFEIIEKTENSCIIKTTIEYEVMEEAAANASLVSIEPLVKLMEASANSLIKNHT